ncbi:MAG: pre-peptidase C-terminal domain-containing protein [Acidobacteria bacterium]|nr:pre-peptidase C-terminal domain-containing protein [Acidobacteriota bacterium]
MTRPPRPLHATALVFSLVIFAAAGAGLFGARASAARQKSGSAAGSKLGDAAVKTRTALGPSRRAGKRPSDGAAQAGAAAAIAACVETPISIPTTLNATLTTDDCQLQDATRYDVYRFNGTAGQQVSVTLTSADFDAYLFLMISDGQSLVVLGEDNDGGGGTNARIPSGSGVATLPYTGTYYILANALEPSDTLGNYTLTVATLGGTCPASPAAIGFGTRHGTLFTGDCRFVDDTFYDAYSFSGTAGQQVSISLSSDSFDAVLYLLDGNRNVLGLSDDGGGGTNARLPATSGFVTLPFTGSYLIVVSEIPPDDIDAPPATGAYTLLLGDGGMCPSAPITVGQTINNASLSAGDCKLPDESFFDLYTFSGTAGQQVAVHMSGDFDAYLYLVGPDGQVIAEDDDGGGGTSARIPAGTGFFTLPTTGTYRIIANQFSAGTTGTYTLSLTAPAPPSTTLQLTHTTYNGAEGGIFATLTVTRAGFVASEVSVGYFTTDGTATERKDYTAAVGRVRLAANETSRSFNVLITDDRFDDDNESFTVTLTAPGGATLGPQTSATVTIADNDAADGPSPVKEGSIDTEFFVRQHYADFLNRAPDASGLAFWVGQTTGCGNPDLLVCRVNVSAAFFLSIEFQETGFLTYRAHKVAYGNLPGKPVPLTLREFLAGSRRIGEGVAVNVGNWEAQLEANKVAFFNEFVADSRFTALYPQGMSSAAFVDALNANAGGVLSTAERNALVADLGSSAKTRAQVLRAVAEDADLAQREFRPAFVLAQYFGYLRRNPDDAGFDGQPDPNFVGYNFWLGKLNQFNGNYVEAEMVKAFITSLEYQNRFGQ